jgi:hypothetical protein
MKLGRLNHIGIATSSIADSLPVIASVARQSSGRGRQSGLPRRYAPRNDDGGNGDGDRNDGGASA